MPSVVLKYVMAASGAAMLLYLVLHMLGNLKIFFGAGALDAYSAWLRTLLEPAVPYSGVLWVIRVVLTVALVAHVWSAIVLARRARAARPVRYTHRPPVQGSYAARTMRWGGVIIALFVVYHLLDLTTGTLNPNGVHGEVYDNVAADFAPSHWYATIFYVLAVVTVGIHVRHGLWSGLQTFGRSNARTQRALKTFALVFAALLVAGFLAVPFAVTFGLV
ncbi:succinate dehydrogenase cytochrome b subunit [Pseudonocardia benzenivorans]|uniref:Succinate dehydrogenase cytochrome b subunit n=1 Tax=Pseudonocardia benzenivorans TaxID=228005 RepID=A0ABW3VA23_9PSEU|nr:succinate dehydrogenase [Pseudonocardia sp. D17]